MQVRSKGQPIRELENWSSRVKNCRLILKKLNILQSFKNMNDKESYKKKNNVYNTDKTVSKNEMSALGFKASKSCITAMVCGNVAGMHRLPLLIIGKYKNQHCFKEITK
ncbi:hypothetical protein PR048_024718 [Dryococelus australis]|uniref:DDE-1 domain-containing protein n=1 Tax=Dryococelus australis TaxID=614101 RepID=A0ABQ9GPB5_9NEOP|nr:hypothetical protein PR048_024718 [Dryococelus australis]